MKPVDRPAKQKNESPFIWIPCSQALAKRLKAVSRRIDIPVSDLCDMALRVILATVDPPRPASPETPPPPSKAKRGTTEHVGTTINRLRSNRS